MPTSWGQSDVMAKLLAGEEAGTLDPEGGVPVRKLKVTLEGVERFQTRDPRHNERDEHGYRLDDPRRHGRPPREAERRYDPSPPRRNPERGAERGADRGPRRRYDDRHADRYDDRRDDRYGYRRDAYYDDRSGYLRDDRHDDRYDDRRDVGRREPSARTDADAPRRERDRDLYDGDGRAERPGFSREWYSDRWENRHVDGAREGERREVERPSVDGCGPPRPDERSPPPRQSSREAELRAQLQERHSRPAEGASEGRRESEEPRPSSARRSPTRRRSPRRSPDRSDSPPRRGDGSGPYRRADGAVEIMPPQNPAGKWRCKCGLVNDAGVNCCVDKSCHWWADRRSNAAPAAVRPSSLTLPQH